MKKSFLLSLCLALAVSLWFSAPSHAGWFHHLVDRNAEKYTRQFIRNLPQNKASHKLLWTIFHEMNHKDRKAFVLSLNNFINQRLEREVDATFFSQTESQRYGSTDSVAFTQAPVLEDRSLMSRLHFGKENALLEFVHFVQFLSEIVKSTSGLNTSQNILSKIQQVVVHENVKLNFITSAHFSTSYIFRNLNNLARVIYRTPIEQQNNLIESTLLICEAADDFTIMTEVADTLSLIGIENRPQIEAQIVELNSRYARIEMSTTSTSIPSEVKVLNFLFYIEYLKSIRALSPVYRDRTFVKMREILNSLEIDDRILTSTLEFKVAQALKEQR